MTQSLCGNCGTGLPYGSGWCPGCGMAVAPAVPQAPVPPSFPAQGPPTQPQYAQPGYQAAPPTAYPQGAPMPPAGYAPAPYGTYGGGPGVPPPGWGALEAFLTGDWLGPAKSAVLAVVAMLGVSLVGMLLVAGGELGFGETVVLILAGPCLAVGGDGFFEAEVRSFETASASVSIGVLPLTVTLVGMLVLGVTFARRQRRRGVTRGSEVLADLGRTALVFALFFIPLPLLARYTPGPFEDSGLGDLVDFDGRVGVGVWSTLFGALLFAVATMGLVALLRPSAPLLGRFQPRVLPALRAALVVFAAGTIGAVVFVIWALAENGGDDGVPQFLGVSLLAFVNGALAVVLWTAGVPLTGEGGLTDEVSGSSSVTLLTFTEEVSGAFWLAPVVLLAVMLPVAVVLVLRQHTMPAARLEGLRFAAALGFVALAAALLLRMAVDSSAGGGGFRGEAGASATFNPFLAAFVLALWGAVTGLLAPAVAAGLPPHVVQSVRRRYGMAPAPAPAPMPAPAPVQQPAPPQQWQ